MFCHQMITVIFCLLTLRSPPCFSQSENSAPTEDGVLRVTLDGRAEAYLVPPFNSSHASNLLILPNHDILLAWFSGAREGVSDVAIVLSRLVHGTRQFSKATVVSQRHGFSNQNPVLFRESGSGRLYLFHSQQEANKGEANAEIWALEANDELGLNWTEPKVLFAKAGSFDRNRVVETLAHTWLLPIYYSRPGDETVSAVKECLHHEVFADDWVEHPIHDSTHLVQPSIVRPKPDQPRLLAFFRDRRAKNIYRSVSEDDGKTWLKPTKTTLPNNNSGIQASTLQSGNIAIVYNPTTHGRNPLVISLSEDGGLTWPYTRTLDSSNIETDEFSYPSIAQHPDGQIHISHTYLRQTIKYQIIPSEQWIREAPKVV